MKPAFVVSNLNKGKYVYKAVAGALSQNIPCDVLITDAQSTDNSWDEIQRAVKEAPRGAEHTVRAIQSPMKGVNNFRSFGEHFAWAVEQTENEWFLHGASDDYSFPGRARACMQAVAKNKCVAVGTNMQMVDPMQPGKEMSSGVAESGYVSAGFGLNKLVFGSLIAGYKREWLKKVGPFACTPDVYYGFLAALNEGYYAVAEIHHAHLMAVDEHNLGFQGKMRAAELSGNREEITRINELNRYQLFELYFLTAKRANELYPMAHDNDKNAIAQMIINQGIGWYQERATMHANKWMPGVI